MCISKYVTMLTFISYVVVFALGALTSYLALRNNPKYKTKADELTDKVATKL